MSQALAVARLMIAEGIRMKIALVFLALIGMVILGVPLTIKGDSSLTGAVQSFMSYGLSATAVLLSMLTIFMSRSLSDEFVHHQIFLVMSKPVPRWQFIVGKWLGMTVLNAAFLACAGATIYGMVYYIKSTHPPIDNRFDEAELVNEVLVARHALQTKIPDFSDDAELEFERNLEQGLYANAGDIRPDAEKKRLAQKHEARWRVVGPLDARVFEFENVLCDRSKGNTIQLRYKTEVTQYAPDEIFRGAWVFGDAMKGTREYPIPTRHVVGRYHTIQVPADAVADDHTLLVRFYNRNPYEGERQHNNVIEFRKSDPVEILFVVGSFEWNFVRLLILMQCKLMFLAAVALLGTTVFSFPVACLTSFTVYILAGTRSFLTEALDFASDDYATMFSSAKEFFVQSFTYLYSTVHWIIPDFGYYDAVETFVNGRNVSLVWVLQAVTELVLIQTVIVLGLAVLLFHRREVAEVSF
ncbi:MAG: ABC transporter permease [Planctomycetes bacterium]|nr:ABC transporter permease [Planctomycetota bacterium]